MSGFVIVEVVEVSNPAGMQEYAARAQATVEQFGGRYRVLRGKTDVVEGSWSPGPLVMLEFPSMEKAKAWYASPEYHPLIALRQAASKMNFIFVEGLD